MKSPQLTELKKQLREQAPPPAAKPAAAPAKSRFDDDERDEQALFTDAMRGVQRIRSDAADLGKPRPDPLAPVRRAAAVGTDDDHKAALSDTAALLAPVGAEAQLEFARSGIQERVMRRLRQGQPGWEAAVDLHGCTLDQAREAILQLLSQARRDGLHMVKIVHGKGQQSGEPLMKTAVNGWLRQLAQVNAFVSAQPRDGGTGALYVLLKRERRDQDADKA